MKISAAIITHNEELNIARAIESLRCCDEIVVVDSGSNDRTVEIAANYGARVIETHWRGYAAQKNFASEACENDWVFSLDADEALSEALEGEIWQFKKHEPPAHYGYTVPRMAQYLGRWILHSGWYPDRKIRLFHRQHARWVGEFVHESVTLEGSVGHFESNLLHYTCSSLSEHLKTMDRYTTLAAEQIIDQGKRVQWHNLAIDPAWTFFRTYVLQRGYLDGSEGLAIAYMAGIYTFLKYAKAQNMGPRR
jgi:glycosyltransferase involved in cell wall biosynthesis